MVMRCDESTTDINKKCDVVQNKNNKDSLKLYYFTCTLPLCFVIFCNDLIRQ